MSARKESEIAFLGPLGTYSHMVAEKRFGRRMRMTPLPSIRDVCARVASTPGSLGVIPIENSSGGTLYETVDILVENAPPVRIVEELALNVQLALLGRRGETIRTLYSHFAPLDHCAKWIAARLPGVTVRAVPSTAAAAEKAAARIGAAALGARRLARLYDLDVLRFPVQADTPNLTVFLVVAGSDRQPLAKAGKITAAVRLPNRAGSLCAFLEAFRDEGINLSRLVSRPIRGCPREYAFLVDIQGAMHRPAISRALAKARAASQSLRIVGAYPCRLPYRS